MGRRGELATSWQGQASGGRLAGERSGSAGAMHKDCWAGRAGAGERAGMLLARGWALLRCCWLARPTP